VTTHSGPVEEGHDATWILAHALGGGTEFGGAGQRGAGFGDAGQRNACHCNTCQRTRAKKTLRSQRPRS
ncbi:MAG: hypothetical protein E7K68_02080, partial [Corynebacterium kroppenstedtii]|nr:hypothetical protein [Corynebacterium kroppenstedtii]